MWWACVGQLCCKEWPSQTEEVECWDKKSSFDNGENQHEDRRAWGVSGCAQPKLEQQIKTLLEATVWSVGEMNEQNETITKLKGEKIGVVEALMKAQDTMTQQAAFAERQMQELQKSCGIRKT